MQCNAMQHPNNFNPANCQHISIHNWQLTTSRHQSNDQIWDCDWDPGRMMLWLWPDHQSTFKDVCIPWYWRRQKSSPFPLIWPPVINIGMRNSAILGASWLHWIDPFFPDRCACSLPPAATNLQACWSEPFGGPVLKGSCQDWALCSSSVSIARTLCSSQSQSLHIASRQACSVLDVDHLQTCPWWGPQLEKVTKQFNKKPSSSVMNFWKAVSQQLKQALSCFTPSNKEIHFWRACDGMAHAKRWRIAGRSRSPKLSIMLRYQCHNATIIAHDNHRYVYKYKYILMQLMYINLNRLNHT